MRPLCLTLLASLALAPSAVAQVCGRTSAPPSEKPPILHLTKSASVKTLPTLLVADLTATAHARTAVPAQRSVNDLMARAKTLAGQTPGVTAAFQDYSTDYVDATKSVPAHWIASQTLEIRGQTGEVVLGLVGQVQAIGLTISDLGWQVPPDRAEAARREAAIKALTAVRQQAAAAAHALGLQVRGYETIDLSGGVILRPMPSIRGGAVMMAAAKAAPQATSTPQNITATVSADVILRPAAAPSQARHP